MIHFYLDVAQRFGLCRTAFFTQSCAVDAVYCHVGQGQGVFPLTVTSVSLSALPVLEVSELPSLVSRPDEYPAVSDLLVSQFSNLDRVDWVLVNTFDKLEEKVSSSSTCFYLFFIFLVKGNVQSSITLIKIRLGQLTKANYDRLR